MQYLVIYEHKTTDRTRYAVVTEANTQNEALTNVTDTDARIIPIAISGWVDTETSGSKKFRYAGILQVVKPPTPPDFVVLDDKWTG